MNPLALGSQKISFRGEPMRFSQRFMGDKKLTYLCARKVNLFPFSSFQHCKLLSSFLAINAIYCKREDFKSFHTYILTAILALAICSLVYFPEGFIYFQECFPVNAQLPEANIF